MIAELNRPGWSMIALPGWTDLAAALQSSGNLAFAGQRLHHAFDVVVAVWGDLACPCILDAVADQKYLDVNVHYAIAHLP